MFRLYKRNIVNNLFLEAPFLRLHIRSFAPSKDHQVDEITLMMEAASTSESSVSFYQTTRRKIPEDSHFHTHRRENLISYPLYCLMSHLFIKSVSWI
jgi:hypothetical protein